MKKFHECWHQLVKYSIQQLFGHFTLISWELLMSATSRCLQPTFALALGESQDHQSPQSSLGSVYVCLTFQEQPTNREEILPPSPLHWWIDQKAYFVICAILSCSSLTHLCRPTQMYLFVVSF